MKESIKKHIKSRPERKMNFEDGEQTQNNNMHILLTNEYGTANLCAEWLVNSTGSTTSIPTTSRNCEPSHSGVLQVAPYHPTHSDLMHLPSEKLWLNPWHTSPFLSPTHWYSNCKLKNCCTSLHLSDNALHLLLTPLFLSLALQPQLLSNCSENLLDHEGVLLVRSCTYLCLSWDHY